MIRFTKMHGLGNDYVYVNCLKEHLDGMDMAALARAMSNRHRGVGSDGLILIQPPGEGTEADVRMEMYNADGSRGEMCGNGIRCVAKYVIDHGVVACGTHNPSQNRGNGVSPVVHHGRDARARESLGIGFNEAREIKIQTDRGVLTVWAMLRNGLVDRVRVDMGTPILRPSEIPVALPGERCVQAALEIGDDQYEMTCVSMGNPHAVVFLASVESVDLARLGPLVEHHALFPNRVNFHIASARSRAEVVMQTWERGSGLTEACGTGACAVLVAGVLEDRLDHSATIHLPGGDLAVEWANPAESAGGSVLVTGPAVEVYSGEWPT